MNDDITLVLSVTEYELLLKTLALGLNLVADSHDADQRNLVVQLFNQWETPALEQFLQKISAPGIDRGMITPPTS